MLFFFYENILVIFFSFLLLFCSFFSIISKNTVYAVLFLILSFLSASALLFLFECEFIAFILIMIYVGATAVLFLFVILLMEIKSFFSTTKDIMKYFPIGSFFGILLFFELLYLILTSFELNQYFFMVNSLSNTNKPFFDSSIVLHNPKDTFIQYFNWFDRVDSITNIEIFGLILYSYYLIHFLLAGFILLLALLGAVSLVSNKETRIQQNNNQLVFKQIERKSEL